MAKARKPRQLELVGEARRPREPDTATFEERAKTLFRDRFGVELSDDDLREVTQNLTTYFDLLNEWDRQDAKKQEGELSNDE